MRRKEWNFIVGQGQYDLKVKAALQIFTDPTPQKFCCLCWVAVRWGTQSHPQGHHSWPDAREILCCPNQKIKYGRLGDNANITYMHPPVNPSWPMRGNHWRAVTRVNRTELNVLRMNTYIVQGHEVDYRSEQGCIYIHICNSVTVTALHHPSKAGYQSYHHELLDHSKWWQHSKVERWTFKWLSTIKMQQRTQWHMLLNNGTSGMRWENAENNSHWQWCGCQVMPWRSSHCWEWPGWGYLDGKRDERDSRSTIFILYSAQTMEACTCKSEK